MDQKNKKLNQKSVQIISNLLDIKQEPEWDKFPQFVEINFKKDEPELIDLQKIKVIENGEYILDARPNHSNISEQEHAKIKLEAIESMVKSENLDECLYGECKVGNEEINIKNEEEDVINETEQERLQKLTLPCPIIEKNRVVNCLNSLDKGVIIGEDQQPTSCNILTKDNQVFLQPEVSVITNETEDVQIPVGQYSGPLKKRKHYGINLKTRKILKAQQIAKKHPVLPGCSGCQRKCFMRVLEETRKKINEEFWKLSKTEQKSYIINTCKRLEIRRRKSTDVSRKQNTFKYCFNNDKGETVEVCKIFFLTTLGYKKTNDRVLHDTLSKTPKGQLTPLRHGNLNRKSQNKIDDTEIKAHIKSFKPETNHLKESAPKSRHVGSDITISVMFNDFQKKFPNIKVSYETYRRRLYMYRLDLVPMMDL